MTNAAVLTEGQWRMRARLIHAQATRVVSRDPGLDPWLALRDAAEAWERDRWLHEQLDVEL